MSTTEKHVMVPQSDIDDLERARLEAFEILKDFGLDNDFRFVSVVTNVTSPMWRISHRRYEEVTPK